MGRTAKKETCSTKGSVNIGGNIILSEQLGCSAPSNLSRSLSQARENAVCGVGKWDGVVKLILLQYNFLFCSFSMRLGPMENFPAVLCRNIQLSSLFPTCSLGRPQVVLCWKKKISGTQENNISIAATVKSFMQLQNSSSVFQLWARRRITVEIQFWGYSTSFNLLTFVTQLVVGHTFPYIYLIMMRSRVK